MDISPVGFQLPTIMPHPESPAEANIHKSAPVPKDPYSELDTMPGLNSELYTLKVIKNIRDEYRHGLDEYLELRKRNNVKEFTDYLETHHFKTLGVENWVVGIIGLGYQVEKFTPDFLDALFKTLSIELVRANIFEIQSILQLFSYRADFLVNDSLAKEEFIKQLVSKAFTKHLAVETDNVFQIEQIFNLGLSLVEQLNLKKIPKYISSFQKRFPTFPIDFMERNRVLAVEREAKTLFLKSATSINENYIYTYMMVAYYSDIIVRYSKDVIDQVSSSLGISMGLVRIDALDREIKKLIYKVQSGFFVILTDYPLEHHAHKVVETRHDPIHKIRIFYDEFSRLFDRGFQKIFVIVANKEFFSSYYFAKQAKHGMEHRVYVLDSQTFGLGLETLIDTSAAYLRLGHSEHDVLNYINERRQQMKYWVVALDIKRIKKKYWMAKLERERKKPFTSKQIPLLSLANSFDVVSTHTSKKIAFESLMRVVEDALTTSKDYTKLVINAETYQLDFLSYLQGVLHRYPGLDLQITPMSSFLKKQFGDHVGICLI